jgi:arginyl-tRNA synthetase
MAGAPAGVRHLTDLVQGLSLESATEKYPNCFPSINPLDLIRAHLADVLEPITGVDPKIIYNALAWTSGLDKGDLILATPALRLKGKKPDELAKEFVAKVGRTSHAALRD